MSKKVDVWHGTSGDVAKQIFDQKLNLIGVSYYDQQLRMNSTLTDSFPIAVSWAKKRSEIGATVLRYSIPADNLIKVGSLASPHKNNVYITNVGATLSELPSGFFDSMKRDLETLTRDYLLGNCTFYSVLYNWLVEVISNPGGEVKDVRVS